MPIKKRFLASIICILVLLPSLQVLNDMVLSVQIGAKGRLELLDA